MRISFEYDVSNSNMNKDSRCGEMNDGRSMVTSLFLNSKIETINGTLGFQC